MLEKLEVLSQRKREIDDLISDPKIISNQKEYTKLTKEYKELSPIITLFDKYQAALQSLKEAKEIIAEEKDVDREFIEMAEEEVVEKSKEIKQIEEKAKILLIPKDPNDEKNAIVEIRAGTGGDEASLFAGDLFRMLCKYAESKRWKVDIVELHEGTSGGYKEIIFNISGDRVYGSLKFEAGVHRVQRVPKTETQGRVHTSAATVS